MTEDHKFIGESMAFLKSRFEWNKIPDGQELKFEVVNWVLLKTIRHSDSSSKPTWYCEFVAKLDMEFQGIIKGEMVIFTIPYRTFERGIYPVNLSIKKPISLITNLDNVYFHMIKLGKRNIEIKDIQRREEDVELTKKAAALFYDET